MASPATRAGRNVLQPTGFRAFIPAPLPPDPPIAIDYEMQTLLSRADHALGRLDGVAQILPNADLFVAMYVRREAVLSSQIKGTQSSLDDLLAYDLDPEIPGLPDDVEEVVNYVRAMNYGLNRLASLPLSLRLIREIHAELLRAGRGADKQPGEFRRSQNWIAAGNLPISRAIFVPPPVAEMHAALDNFEKFLHAAHELPDLIECGLAHAQFETIHPFLDGNGRVGRLLIAFPLVERGILDRPLLYISHYLKRHHGEYYDRLMAVRTNGDWEGWLRFFLRGVWETSAEATQTARAIVAMREEHRSRVCDRGMGDRGQELLDLLFRRPLLHANLAAESLGVSFPTAGRLIGQAIEIGLLEEVTGARRNRRFRYAPYLVLFADREEIESAGTQPLSSTENHG
jgi:Fic family protein